MLLLFSFNSNMKNILDVYVVFSEWITSQYYDVFLGTDLNPCLNVHCPRFGVRGTYSAHDARCECDDQCPSYNHIKTQSTLRTEQLTTTDAGIS